MFLVLLVLVVVMMLMVAKMLERWSDFGYRPFDLMTRSLGQHFGKSGTMHRYHALLKRLDSLWANRVPGVISGGDMVESRCKLELSLSLLW